LIIPLDKLIEYSGNKYVFTRATMQAVDKIANIKDYPEDNLNWKVVSNVLKIMLDEELKFDLKRSVSEAEKNI